MIMICEEKWNFKLHTWKRRLKSQSQFWIRSDHWSVIIQTFLLFIFYCYLSSPPPHQYFPYFIRLHCCCCSCAAAVWWNDVIDFRESTVALFVLQLASTSYSNNFFFQSRATPFLSGHFKLYSPFENPKNFNL